MDKVFKPKKSILITPAFSIIFPSYCVMSKSTSLLVATGINSLKSLGAIMIPAACIPVPLTEPSNISACRNTSPAKDSS